MAMIGQCWLSQKLGSFNLIKDQTFTNSYMIESSVQSEVVMYVHIL